MKRRDRLRKEAKGLTVQIGEGNVKRALLISALIATTAAPASASASTQIGQTINPAGSACSPNVSWFQGTAPNSQFVVPTDGVITSWSFLGGTTVPSSMKLKVGRIGVTTLDVVAQSDPQTLVANTLNTFTSRVPAHAGEVIGFYFPAPGLFPCAANPAAGYSAQFISGDVAPGTNNVGFTTDANTHLDLSATLEPDADHDGFGDETQDKCIGTPGSFNGCPNSVTIDSAKQKGTKPKIVVTATVPGVGTLAAGAANDASLASASASTTLQAVSQTITSTSRQQVTLTLKLTKSAKKKLAGKGKLKTQVKVVYTPSGGPAGSQTSKVKLKS